MAISESLVLALACEFGLRTLSFGRFVRAIGGLSVRPDDLRRRPLSVAAFDRLAMAARVSVRIVGVTHGTCLRESLVLLLLLKRRGVKATLRFGVRRVEALEAHAWVEFGESVGEGQSFTALLPPLAPASTPRA